MRRAEARQSTEYPTERILKLVRRRSFGESNTASRKPAQVLPSVGRKAFPDHHKYSGTDVEALEKQAAALGATGLVTTEKDAHNIPPEIFRMPVRVAVSNSFGFGGHNAVLAFRKHQAVPAGLSAVSR